MTGIHRTTITAAPITLVMIDMTVMLLLAMTDTKDMIAMDVLPRPDVEVHTEIDTTTGQADIASEALRLAMIIQCSGNKRHSHFEHRVHRHLAFHLQTATLHRHRSGRHVRTGAREDQPEASIMIERKLFADVADLEVAHGTQTHAKSCAKHGAVAHPSSFLP